VQRIKLTLAVLIAMTVIPGKAFGSLAGQSSSVVPEAPEGRASQEPYEAFLAPEMSAGGYGWVVGYARNGRLRRSGPAPIPYVGELILHQFSPTGRRSTPPVSGFLLTASQVAAVSVDGGPPIPTRPEVAVPYGWRVLLYEIPGLARNELFGSHRRSVEFTLFDASGQTIMSLPVPEAQYAGPGLTAETWTRPAHPTLGICQLKGDHLPGLTAESGTVLSRFRSPTSLASGSFQSCASTEYVLHGQVLEAAVLLDGEHPGSAPAAIPGMESVPGHAGVVQSRVAAENLVGRRIRDAWLLVKGGGDLQQQLVVLAHLRATVHL
jgi:hypothetical protein